jgi:hypothetical protein
MNAKNTKQSQPMIETLEDRAMFSVAPMTGVAPVAVEAAKAPPAVEAKAAHPVVIAIIAILIGM